MDEEYNRLIKEALTGERELNRYTIGERSHFAGLPGKRRDILPSSTVVIFGFYAANVGLELIN